MWKCWATTTIIYDAFVYMWKGQNTDSRRNGSHMAWKYILHCMIMHMGLQFTLTHCGLETPYDDKDLGKYWLRCTCNSLLPDGVKPLPEPILTYYIIFISSVRSSDNHLKAILQQMHQPSIIAVCLEITSLKFHSNLPANAYTASHVVVVEQAKVATICFGQQLF